MDHELYQAIVKGDKGAIERSHLDFHSQKSFLGNTILHTAVEFDKKECVEIILRRCPSLILNTNDNGDTALHVAVRHKLHERAKQLIDGAKWLGIEDVESGEKNSGQRQLLGMVNKEGDTAMHEAARLHGVLMVQQLTEDCHNIEYLANNAGDTPLYLATNRVYSYKMADRILNATSCVHGGGGSDGMTALHAAVLNNNTDMVRILLDKMPNLNKEKDGHGWIALHYAAYRVSIYEKKMIEIFELLLNSYSSVACIQEKSGLSPLHIAASKGNTEVIELLIKHCPDCWQVCDKDGRNFLHIASLTGCLWVIQETMERRDNIFRGCINKPDKDGNTPMHLLGKSFPSPQIVGKLWSDDRANWLALNKKNMVVVHAMFEDIFKKFPNTVRKKKSGLLAQLLDGEANEQEQQATSLFPLLDAIEGKHVTRENVERQQDESVSKFHGILVIDREDVREPFVPKFQGISANVLKRQNVAQKVSDSHLVVAALIATVTFAAGFALPGGYDPDQGMPALLRFTAFKGFAISNTIATVLSLLAVLIHYLMKIYVDDREQETSQRVTSLIFMTLICTLGAIFAMMIAFVTGTYAVLANSLSLAITSCVLGCSFFVFSFFLLYREIWVVFKVWVMGLRRKIHY